MGGQQTPRKITIRIVIWRELDILEQQIVALPHPIELEARLRRYPVFGVIGLAEPALMGVLTHLPNIPLYLLSAGHSHKFRHALHSTCFLLRQILHQKGSFLCLVFVSGEVRQRFVQLKSRLISGLTQTDLSNAVKRTW